MNDIVDRLRDGTGAGVLTPVGELCAEAADEIERLRDELAACQKDAERLNWLSRQDDRQVKISTDIDAYWYMRLNGAPAATGYPSPREMIDAAMKGGE